MSHISDITMTLTQLALLIWNNQCHPQSYPHHRSKSVHKPLQLDVLLWIHIFFIKIALLESLGIW